MIRLSYLRPFITRSFSYSRRVSLPSRCPSCSSPLPTALPACPCGYISGVPDKVSFHDVLGVPADPNPFIIDLATLRRKFLQAQTICHPDSWATKGSNKKDIAQALSTLVNEAYQNLSKPLSRAEYILKRNGVEISETEQLDDLDFISEIMEAREELESSEGGDSERIIQLANDNDQKIQRLTKDLEVLVGLKDWKHAKAAAVRLKYLQAFERAAKDALRT